MTSAQCLDAVLRGETVPWNTLGTPANSLLSTCETLEISALLHHQLSRSATPCDWPEDVRGELARRARAGAARELVRGREIADVLEALASNGVHPILFKGVALGRLVYDSAGLRPHLDTDLVVHREDIETVRQVLIDRGYEAPPMTDGELVLCQFEMNKTDRFGIEHVFDVHWRISTQTVFANLLTYDELASEALPVPALGPHARAASDVHSLLLACIHPVMHHANTERVIWLYDIHLLVTRLADASLARFFTLAASKHVTAICARYLALAAERFHTTLPPSGFSALLDQAQAEPSAIYLRPGRRWHHEMLWNVRGHTSWRDRIRLLREVLLPGPRYMLETHHLGPLGVVLLPALYLHRCTYGALKILAGRK